MTAERRWWVLALPAQLLFVAIFWPAFQAWFQSDDFVWLGLLREVREGGSLADALFKPSQHGTWRPLGERAFYLASTWLFGWESWPMRVVAFATQLGSLAITARLTLILTASPAAAVMAPVLWAANSKLTVAAISSGAYIHVVCGFCLLLALLGAVRERWMVSWAAFLAGFLAMESTVVFPALLTLYYVLFRKHQWRRTVAFWAVSLIYLGLHMKFAPKMAAGSYAMHLDFSILKTLGAYWRMAFLPENLTPLTGLPEWLGTAGLWIGGTALLGFTLAETLRKHFQALLFLVWFLILLSPVLPLAGHVADYYLTIPLAALGMLGGWAFGRAWTAGPAMRAAAVAIAALYLIPSVPAGHAASRWWQQRSLVAERLVRDVRAVHEANPGKTIVLSGLTSEQFWAAVAHYPFVERRKTYVFLTPDTRSRIEPHPESGVRMDEFFLTALEDSRLRGEGQIVEFAVR